MNVKARNALKKEFHCPECGCSNVEFMVLAVQTLNVIGVQSLEVISDIGQPARCSNCHHYVANKPQSIITER